MKKILLKLNMIIIFVVVLFANVCFAEVSIGEDIGEKIGEPTEIAGFVRVQKIKVKKTGTYRLKSTDDDYKAIRVSYGNGSVRTESDVDGTVLVTLTKDSIYGIEHNVSTTINITAVEEDSEGNMVLQEGEETENVKDMSQDTASGVEALITRLFLAIGDVFLAGIKTALGSDLSIDTLVFNKYEGTKISFFSGQTSELNNVLISVVNRWYNILSNFTYILYVVILVYIGIMIVATSGTAKQDRAKAYFADWVVGLFILMFLPYYGFPFLFRINDALVEYVGRGSSTFQTYYNLVEKYEVSEIKGGDSYTKLVEKIEGELNETKLQGTKERIRITIQLVTAKISIQNSVLRKLDLSDDALEVNRNYINMVLDNLYNHYCSYRDLGNDEESAYDKVIGELESGKDDIRVSSNLYYTLIAEIKNRRGSLQPMFENAYDCDIKTEELTQDLESLNKDIMGTMRSLAGSKLRLVYAILWFMLIFQLIGLTVLYYKRIFVIALLIAIFPLIMLFYCIDKMADGSAQTFSMWMKEFLANIFVQTVHAIIYAVLVGMGLQIYTGGEENWIFLVGAMFLLLPAEAIMKEIFDLNGSTLSQVGGTFTKVAMGVGALTSLVTAGKSEKDKSIKAANEKRMTRLQNSQNRADMKAKAREMRRTYQFDKNEGKYTAISPDKRKISKLGKVREGIYHGATSARKAYAKAAPKIGRVTRGVKSVAGVTVGAIYAASGGDTQSLIQGVAIAKGISGKSKDADKKPDLKTELKAAQDRQKEREQNQSQDKN